jgi:DNA invertase Pin-like site-specific DNA recombinase
MSRSAEEGFALYQHLFNMGVHLVFLKEPHINTDTYRKALAAKVELTGDKVDFILVGVNRYLMELAKEQIRIAFEQSQKEVDDLRQRTREGMETAKMNGKQIGQKAGAKLHVKKSDAAKKVIQIYSKDFGGSLSDKDVMKLAGISPNTYYKYKAALKKSSAAN